MAISDTDIAAGERAAAYLNGLIRGPAAPVRQRTPGEAIAIGRRRLARMGRFLDRLGNPHEGLRIVHVGGTSGKGSVAVKIAAGLSAAGYRAGLHCTPYLQTPLEKFECDGRLAQPGELAELVAWIRPGVEAMARDDADGPPSYGMVWVALTFEYFRRLDVDALVLEVGAGGRFDLTNVVRPVLSVVTSVGLDHRKSLGGTLASIAWHKAGIWKAGVPALIGAMPAAARRVLMESAERSGAPLFELGRGLGTERDFRRLNATLAQAALDRLRDLGYERIDERVGAAVAAAALPGRLETMPGSARVLLDGAHNPDKAQALAQVLGRQTGGGPLVLVSGVVGYRSAQEVLAPLLPLTQAWIATEPRVFGKPPTPVAEMAAAGAELGQPPVDQLVDPPAAIERALEICPADGTVLVAGSLYLAGNVRERWYATGDIVRQRTMWPVRSERLRHT